MAGAEAPVTADAGIETKEEQQQAVVGNGVGRAGAKSSAQQNGAGSETAVVDNDHGFTRAEVNSQPLVGSVSYYERHIFLCYKEPKSWPPNVEAGDFDRLPRYLVAALRARKNDMPKKTRLTLCDGLGGPHSSVGDVLIFPDMLRFRGLTHFDVDTFVEDVLVKEKEWEGIMPESLSGSHIFVCSHGSRDQRCGCCGPALVEKLKDEINRRGLERQIVVRPCSHIGGHKYAGNLIVYSLAGTDTVSGHWYGYVTPADIQVILDQHIGRGEIIDRLWRGQMGAGEEDQKLAQQDRLDRLEDGNKGCACCESPVEADGASGQNGSACRQSNEPGQNGSDCCQSNEPGQNRSACCQSNEPGQNGSACCQSHEPGAIGHGQVPDFLRSTGTSAHDGQMIFPDDDSSTDEETEPGVKLWGSHYIPLPKWTEKWEGEDTNAVLAVLGAAAAVAVAFHFYKQSS